MNIIKPLLTFLGFRVDPGERRGVELPCWRSFRAWSRRKGDRPYGVWRIEWQAPTQFLFVGISADPGERELQVKFGCLLFAIWISRETKWPALWAWMEKHWRYEEVEINVDWNWSGVNFFDGFLHWNLLTPADSWESKTPKWRNGSFHPLDFILGRHDHNERVVEDWKPIVVPMPEGCYAGQARVLEASWKRRRLPWISKRNVSVHVKMFEPLPHPGKGESAWDCGEDATYESHCGRSKTIAEAVGSMVAGSMRSRLNYGGGFRFKPEKQIWLQRPNVDFADKEEVARFMEALSWIGRDSAVIPAARVCRCCGRAIGNETHNADGRCYPCVEQGIESVISSPS